MKFYMPTKVYFGENSIENNYNILNGLGKNTLIVTGKRSCKLNGSLKDVLNALDKLNVNYMIFDEVEENPSLETIEKGAKLGRSFNCDYVIGIGGGSPLDASKAIALMIKNKELTKDTIITTEKLESVPVIAVPTTAGTGSEVTQYSIVTDHKNNTKLNLGQTIFPIIAFCDPKYTEHMSYETSVSTAIDAFSHLVESYLNVNATIITDTLIEKGLMMWGECLENLLNEKINYDVRKKLMMVSTIGGIVIAQTGTSLPHGMGYALTYNKHIPHGLANGVLYKEYFKVFKNRTKINNIIRLLGLSKVEELEEVLTQLINVVVILSDEEIKDYTDLIWNNKNKIKNHPEEISYEELYGIYKNTFSI